MFQVKQGSGIETVFVDQGIGSLSPLLHRFPQGLIADQETTSFQKDSYTLSFQKRCFTILKYVSIMIAKGGEIMDQRLDSLYCIPNIAECEDICLQTLREHCASLEIP